MSEKMRRNSSASLLFSSTEGKRPTLTRQNSRTDVNNNDNTTEGISHFKRLLHFIYPSQKRRRSFSSFIKPTSAQGQTQQPEDMKKNDDDSLLTIDDDDIVGYCDDFDDDNNGLNVEKEGHNDAEHNSYSRLFASNGHRRLLKEEIEGQDPLTRKRKSFNRRAMYIPNDPVMHASDGPKDEWHAWRLYCSTYQKLLLRQSSIPLSEHLHLRKMLVTLQQKNLDLFSRRIQEPKTNTSSIFDIVKYDSDDNDEEDSTSSDSDTDSDSDNDEVYVEDRPLNSLLLNRDTSMSGTLKYTKYRAGNDYYDINKALYAPNASILPLTTTLVHSQPAFKSNNLRQKSILQKPATYSPCFQHNNHTYHHRSPPVVQFV